MLVSPTASLGSTAPTAGAGGPPVLSADFFVSTESLHAAILQALVQPPYCLVLRAPALTSVAGAVEALLSPLAADQRLSFTRVQVDAAAAAKPSAGTRYSRTALALPLHTDTAHAKRPHSLVAFAMIRPDKHAGGLSIMATAAEVVERLSANTILVLRAPRHDFGKGLMPILWGPPEAPSIRYYRTQIDACAARSGRSIINDVEALDELDQVLSSLSNSRVCDLDAGDILILNNHKALHGRTGFSAESDRLMHRYRLRVAALE